MNRFDYVQYDQRAKNSQEFLKEQFQSIEAYVDHFFMDCPNKENIMKALEEAYMWCGKVVRDDCVKRGAAIGKSDRGTVGMTAGVPLQEQRTNS